MYPQVAGQILAGGTVCFAVGVGECQASAAGCHASAHSNLAESYLRLSWGGWTVLLLVGQNVLRSYGCSLYRGSGFFTNI